MPEDHRAQSAPTRDEGESGEDFWGEETEEGPPAKSLEERALDFQERQFAYGIWIVGGVALLLCLAAAGFYFEPSPGTSARPASPGEAIFDAAKTILPPIATLVLGAYYSSRSER